MSLINQDMVLMMSGYLRRLVTLDQLKKWLAESTWELSESASPLDRMMVGELEIALAEYDRGDRDVVYLVERIWFLLKLPNPALSPVLMEEIPTPLAA